MKTIFIAGSRKFSFDILSLVDKLTNLGCTALTPQKEKIESDAEGERQALLLAFKQIDESDFVYVYAKDGYIGKTVAIEMGYAFAKGKKIIASELLKEFSAQALVSEIKDEETLLNNGVSY
jgi:nucleoside 2-deoxyribosyltransferase